MNNKRTQHAVEQASMAINLLARAISLIAEDDMAHRRVILTMLEDAEWWVRAARRELDAQNK